MKAALKTEIVQEGTQLGKEMMEVEQAEEQQVLDVLYKNKTNVGQSELEKELRVVGVQEDQNEYLEKTSNKEHP